MDTGTNSPRILSPVSPGLGSRRGASNPPRYDKQYDLPLCVTPDLYQGGFGYPTSIPRHCYEKTPPSAMQLTPSRLPGWDAAHMAPIQPDPRDSNRDL